MKCTQYVIYESGGEKTSNCIENIQCRNNEIWNLWLGVGVNGGWGYSNRKVRKFTENSGKFSEIFIEFYRIVLKSHWMYIRSVKSDFTGNLINSDLIITLLLDWTKLPIDQ